MYKILLKEIEDQAIDLSNQFNQYHNYQEIEFQRNKRRIGTPPPKQIFLPEEWSEDKKYNPFYVLKKRKQIARSITKKLLKGVYIPNKPKSKEIPKKNGGTRTVSIYQIPDSAVSYRFYVNLLNKNKHRFSSLTYAYRKDRNVHFAIQDIANEIISTQRIFVAEYDFRNFFSSIPHPYLLEQLDKNAFLISPLEKKVIEAFLSHNDKKGIPLGTSISLFLANVACWKLDRDLEDEGIRFARYADDTIIWSKDYSKISKAVEIINKFSIETGIEINYQKSDGVSLLQNKVISS